jgi:hypothetical protein
MPDKTSSRGGPADHDVDVKAHIRDARLIGTHDRDMAIAMLNDLFRRGQTPDPAPDGRYRGEVLVIDIAPGLTRLVGELVDRADPWLGKHFDAAKASGENILRPSAQPGARLLWPFYGGYRRQQETTLAFPFRTGYAPGRRDPDLTVFKLDYDVEANPRLLLSARRIVDELVQVSDDLYLGKWYVHWYWGSWSMIGFFTLQPGGI